jgi:ElaB/YqjD/DUF883 family membrane-anchored ribosome-binding protein
LASKAEQHEDKPMEHPQAPGGQFKDHARPSSGSGSTVSESLAYGKEAIGAAAADAMNSAGSDLESLRSDLNSLKEAFAKFVSQVGNEATKSARYVTSNLVGQIGDVASDVAGKGADIASAASHQAKSFASELESMARRNPIGAIAGAVLIGVMIGMMGRRS